MNFPSLSMFLSGILDSIFVIFGWPSGTSLSDGRPSRGGGGVGGRVPGKNGANICTDTIVLGQSD